MIPLDAQLTEADLTLAIVEQAAQIERALRGGGTAGRDISGAVADAAALPSRTDAAMQVYKCCVCGRTYNECREFVTVPKWAEPEYWSHGYCPTCFCDALNDARKVGAV